jgi:hypothetical protein
MDTFAPHQQRVIDEARDLKEKRDKLASFMEGDIFKGLALDEQDRLRRQHRYMILYNDVLDERIGAF